MKRISVAVLAFAVVSTSHGAFAQTAPATMTVDAVDFNGYRIAVTGVVQGESTPTTHVISFSTTYGTETQRAAAYDACHRRLLLALAKPGQYLVRAGPDACTVQLAAP